MKGLEFEIEDNSSPLILPYLVPICLSLFLTLVFLVKRNFSRSARLLNKFPGPPVIPLLGNAGIFLGESSEIKDKLGKYFKVYGRCFRFWRFGQPQLMVADHLIAEKILSSTKINKKPENESRKHYLGEGLGTSSGQKWIKDRKEITSCLNQNLIQEGNLEMFNDCSRKLVNCLREQFLYTTQSKDIFFYIQLTTLNMVAESVLGGLSEIQNMTTFMTSFQIIDAFKFIMEGMKIRSFKPWANLPGMFNLIFRNAKNDIEFFQPFKDNLFKLIEKKQKSKRNKDKILNGKEILLDDLINLKNPQKTSQELYDQMVTLLVEGTDPSANAINYILYLLALHPEIQNKVQSELESIFPDQSLAQNVISSDLDKMNYLEMCIKEALRLFPPIPSISRQVPFDIHLGNKLVIPKDTNVIIWPYELHRDPSIYPKPEIFDPDRFLPEAIAQRPLYSYLPYSTGVRNCPGQSYAMMEIKVILAHVLRRYEVTTSRKREELKLEYGIVLEPQSGGIPMYFKLRN